MKKEYIEKRAVEDMLENAHLISEGEYCGYCTEDIDINSIPVADVVEVRHGVWEPIIDGFGSLEGWIHPECGRTTKEASQYYPTCGAKMDLED